MIVFWILTPGTTDKHVEGISPLHL